MRVPSKLLILVTLSKIKSVNYFNCNNYHTFVSYPVPSDEDDGLWWYVVYHHLYRDDVNKVAVGGK